MPARFEVHRAVNLKDRYLFALQGAIAEGMVRTGMEARLEDDPGDSFRARVHGVEYHPDPGDETPEPTLTFHYRNPDKIRRWESINWDGKKLRLEW